MKNFQSASFAVIDPNGNLLIREKEKIDKGLPTSN